MPAFPIVRSIATALAAAACLAWLPGAAAQDAERGRKLYENHCLECHYERIHKRDPSRSLIRSYAGLQAEVARRGTLTSQRFAIEDLNDIAEYLNRSHYRLAK